MRPVKIKDENITYTAPAGWDRGKDGPCGGLSCRREPFANNRIGIYSNWKPSAEELAALNAGGVVELHCVGIQPPVSVGVVPEHKE